jgi:hypothetical protein
MQKRLKEKIIFFILVLLVVPSFSFAKNNKSEENNLVQVKSEIQVITSTRLNTVGSITPGNSCKINSNDSEYLQKTFTLQGVAEKINSAYLLQSHDVNCEGISIETQKVLSLGVHSASREGVIDSQTKFVFQKIHSERSGDGESPTAVNAKNDPFAPNIKSKYIEGLVYARNSLKIGEVNKSLIRQSLYKILLC